MHWNYKLLFKFVKFKINREIILSQEEPSPQGTQFTFLSNLSNFK